MVHMQKVKTITQIKKIEEIAGEIWNEHFVPIIGKPQVDYMLSKFQSAEAIRQQIKKGYSYYIIVSDNVYAGYFSILPQKKHNTMFLSKLYIYRQFRRTGLARAAVEHIKNVCCEFDISKIRLTVNKNNTDSINAYKKLGFKNAGSIVQDIDNGFVMDDYVMEMSF